MRQQINLYQPVLLKTRHRFSAGAMAAALMVLAAGLAVLGGYGAWQVHRLEGVLAAADARQRQLDRRLEGVRRRLQRAQDPVLRARVDALSTRLARERALLRTLAGVELDAGPRFSGYLLALARSHLRGLWVRGLEAERGGRLILRGATFQPALLPGYLERLGQQPAFRDRRFQVFELRRPQAGEGGGGEGAGGQAVQQAVRFRLETRPPPRREKAS